MTSPARRAHRGLSVALVVSMAGMLLAQNVESRIGYCMLTASALFPFALWIRAGMPGIPVWPAVAAVSWLYYAVPMLRDHVAQTLYTPAEILSLAATVSIFLAAGTAAWRALFSGIPRRAGPDGQGLLNAAQETAMIFLGLGLGLLLLVYLEFWFSLGSYFGLARSVMMTACCVACYLLGHARGTGDLRGFKWSLSLTLLVANVLVAWTSLFLITGMTELLAAVAGYLLTTKRVPWIPIAASCLVLTVLHAGKAEMRQHYWAQNPDSTVGNTLTGAPVLLAEWFGAGLTTLTRGEEVPLMIDRASLFQLLLSVQRLAPQSVSFLEGETYGLLPNMLVPRFLAPDKSVSQAAMIMLNVRFGFQSLEDTRTTAIGWGLITEAFANFGLLGVCGMGLVAGSLAGILARCSYGASPVSAGTLTAIVGLVAMINMEADFAGLLSALWQSLASIAVLTVLVRLFPAARRARLYPLLRTNQALP